MRVGTLSRGGPGGRLLPLFVLAFGPLVGSAGGSAAPLQFESTGDPQLPTVAAVVGDPALRVQLATDPVAVGRAILPVVRVDESSGELGPPLFGRYRMDDSTLRFTPAFRLAEGVRYRAVLSLPGAKPVRVDYFVPKSKPIPGKRAAIEAIYPTTADLPANLLKFYIVFSKPMRETAQVFDRLHLLDADGKAVDDPWRRQSMWSDDGRRLTLLIHPGRIKKGVNLREQLGPVLEPDQSYTLLIEAGILDAHGLPMTRPFAKHFTTTAEDNRRPSPTDWQLQIPTVGTVEPLIVRFEKPLDYALAQRLIRVVDEQEQAVAGEVTLLEHERGWTFRPRHRWLDRPYQLVVDALLEDLAGNTPARVFDTDLERPDHEPVVLTRRLVPAQ